MAQQATGTARAARWLSPPLALLALSALCSGCGTKDAGDARDADRAAVTRMLARRSASVLHHDAGAFLATVDPAATGYRARQRRLIGNLRHVPLRSWSYSLTGVGGFAPAEGDGRRLAVRVRLDYRLGDAPESPSASPFPGPTATGGAAPTTVEQRLTVAERDGRWYVAAEDDRTADGGQAPRHLWEQGPVAAVTGRHSLVLGVGQPAARLREIARVADRAVPTVDAAWPGGPAGRVVVLVPGDEAAMAALLGTPGGSWAGMAAVTTGEAGGPGSRRSADRVIVNPDAYGELGELGRRVVLTHEMTHVATRTATAPGTPLWLSEGFADWVGFSGTGRSARQGAPELAREVASGRSPGGLPRDGDFAGGADPDRLAQAYERGWLACRMIARRWGPHALTGFYRDVGTAGGGEAAVDRALRERFGMSPADFTAAWHRFVVRELR